MQQNLLKFLAGACADGQTRRLRACVVFVAGDMPAVAKVMGYAGHNATSPCGFCHMKSTHDKRAGCNYSIPSDHSSRPRNSEETMKLWNNAEDLCRGSNEAKHRRFVKQWGVTRLRILSKLHLDFFLNAAPMIQCTYPFSDGSST